MAFKDFIPVIGPAIQAGAQWGATKRQARENRKLAEYQNDANAEYLQMQLDYNSPKSQMQRFQDAGLNPALIYGQGNPGSQSEPQKAAEIRPADYQKIPDGLMPLVNQSMLAVTQVDAMKQKTRESGAVTELRRLQADVMANNPLLNESGLEAIISSLISGAEIKAADSSIKKAQADWFTGSQSWTDSKGHEYHGPAGPLKMETELKLLMQRYDLGTADAKIKAEILQSKEFQNDLLEIQTAWMKDGEVNPQHFLEFARLLLMSLIKR